MTKGVDYIGSEPMPPEEGPFQPRRYKVTYKCLRCAGSYSRIFKTIPKDDPPCPKKACIIAEGIAEQARMDSNRAKIVEEGRAPGVIGANITVKAVDATANIVMEDYKLTDLKDSVRPGEGVAPPLPRLANIPNAQAAADNYFGGGQITSGGRNAKQVELMRRKAIAGAYRGMAINPAAMVPGKRGENPLWSVRSEALKEKPQ